MNILQQKYNFLGKILSIYKNSREVTYCNIGQFFILHVENSFVSCITFDLGTINYNCVKQFV